MTLSASTTIPCPLPVRRNCILLTTAAEHWPDSRAEIRILAARYEDRQHSAIVATLCFYSIGDSIDWSPGFLSSSPSVTHSRVLAPSPVVSPLVSPITCENWVLYSILLDLSAKSRAHNPMRFPLYSNYSMRILRGVLFEASNSKCSIKPVCTLVESLRMIV